MNDARAKALIVLLAVASIGTALLVGLNAVAQRGRPADDDGPAGRALPRQGAPEEELPVLGEVPPFSLTERSERTVTRDDMLGKVWVGNFIFSHCPGPCPMMTSQMAELQMELDDHPRWDDIRLVSFSVDPQRDTPERLREYAGSAMADEEHWLFLTGERDALWDLANRGFKLYVGENAPAAAPAEGPIVHAQKFALVDARGRIRGYYDGLDEEGQARLRRDLERVLAETPAAAGAAPGSAPRD